MSDDQPCSPVMGDKMLSSNSIATIATPTRASGPIDLTPLKGPPTAARVVDFPPRTPTTTPTPEGAAVATAGAAGPGDANSKVGALRQVLINNGFGVDLHTPEVELAIRVIASRTTMSVGNPAPPLQGPSPVPPSGEGGVSRSSVSEWTPDGVSVESEVAHPATRNKGCTGFPDTHPLAVLLDALFIATTALSVAVTIYMMSQQVTPADSVPLFHCLVGSTTYAGLWVVWRLFGVYERRGDWEVVDEPKEIFLHRFRTSRATFALDLVMVVPIDFIAVWISMDSLWYFLVPHLVMLLLRCRRVFTLRRSAEPLVRKRNWVTFLLIVLSSMLVMHICAIVYMSLDGFNFVTALYLTTATVSSVGYGDVVTGDADANRIFTILVIFLGIVMVSSVTGYLASFFSASDSLDEATNTDMRMLSSMLTYYGVKADLRREVVTLFPRVVARNNDERLKSLTRELPRRVRDKLQVYVHAKELKAIDIFWDSAPATLHKIAPALHKKSVRPSEQFITAGDVADKVFFLVRGTVKVTCKGAPVAFYNSGAFFGEMGLAHDTSFRTADVTAVTPCDLLYLTREEYGNISSEKDVAKVFNAITKAAEERLKERPNPLSAP